MQNLETTVQSSASPIALIIFWDLVGTVLNIIFSIRLTEYQTQNPTHFSNLWYVSIVILIGVFIAGFALERYALKLVHWISS